MGDAKPQRDWRGIALSVWAYGIFAVGTFTENTHLLVHSVFFLVLSVDHDRRKEAP